LIRLENDSVKAENKNRSVLILAKGASISLMGRGFSRLLLLVANAILAKVLGPAKYGLFAIGWSMLQISANTGQLGLPQGIIRLGAKYWKKEGEKFRGIVQQSIGLTIVVGMLLAGLLYGFAFEIADIFGKPNLILVIRATSVALVLLLLLKVIAAATRISRRVQYSVIAEDLLPAFTLLMGVLIFTVWLQWGLYGSLISVILSYSIGVIAVIGFLIILYPGILKISTKTSFLRAIFSFSLPASLAGMFGVATRWAARLFLGYFRPEAEVGIYQAAAQLATISIIILAATNTIFIPMISHFSARDDKHELNELYRVSTKWAVYLSLPLTLVLLIYPKDVIHLIYGDAYSQGALILVILTIGQLINAASGAVAPLHLMLGYQVRWMVVTGFSFMVALILNWWLIPIWGMIGAAVADAVSIALLNIVGLLQIRFLVKLWPYDRRYFKGIIAGLGSAGAIFLVGFLPMDAVIWRLLVVGIVAVLVFALILYWQGLDQEDEIIFSAFRARLARPQNNERV